MELKIKRIYESASPDDGTRVLVDRIWPRGVSKDQAKIDHWWKDLAPSTELRKWYAHRVERWQEFRKKYMAGLKHHDEALNKLKALAASGRVTLVYSAKDVQHNQAIVVKDYIENPEKDI